MAPRSRWKHAACGVIPLVLIALSGSVAEIARHQTSGVFEHAFMKPINVDRLLNVLVEGNQ